MLTVSSVLPESTTIISSAICFTLSSVRARLASSFSVMMQTERVMPEEYRILMGRQKARLHSAGLIFLRTDDYRTGGGVVDGGVTGGVVWFSCTPVLGTAPCTLGMVFTSPVTASSSLMLFRSSSSAVSWSSVTRDFA